MEATVPFKKQKDRPLIGGARDLNRFVVCQQRDSKGRSRSNSMVRTVPRELLNGNICSLMCGDVMLPWDNAGS